MFKIFVGIMANFPALGMRTHPMHPHAVRLRHRVIFYISNTLRKLLIRAQGLVFR